MFPILTEFLRLAAWLAVLAAVFIPLERAFTLRRQDIRRPQFGADLFWFFFNGALLSFALAVPAAGLALGAKHLLPAAWLDTVAALPIWLRVVLALVVGDLGGYWGHRWTHEVGLLWRFHAIHHSPVEVDWLTNTRAHPIDLLFTRLCGLTLLFATGLAQVYDAREMLPALATVFSTAWGFFIHANVRWRLGWFEHVLSTPGFHRWHHTNDAMRDRNYAALLPLWDRLFGTLHLPPRAWPELYGIDDPMPDSAAEQMIEPFRR